jgi:YVTN family beta-propeller protein
VFTEEGPHGLAEGLDGDIYVVNRLQRTVTRIDGATFQVKATIGRSSADYLGNLDAQPVLAAISPVDGHLWVTCHANNTVQRIHPATTAIVATLATGLYPWGVKVAADGFV